MFPASTRVPRRAFAPAVTGAIVVASLLVLLSTVSTPRPVDAAASRTTSTQGPAPSEDEISAIVSRAMADLGTNQGECFPWVRRVVQEALGRTMGFDYHTGYLQGGAVEVTVDEARLGDVIQIADPANTDGSATYPGLHTAIVLVNQGGGVFRVIDSNSQFDGVVRIRENYKPAELAARQPNTIVRFYRFPDQPLAPTPAAAPTPATLGGGQAVVRGDGDCLRLRAAPSLNAPSLTCVPDGSTLSLLGATVEADGYVWQQVSFGGQTGWVASAFIEVSAAASTPLPVATATVPPPTSTPTPPPPAIPALTISQQSPPPAAGTVAREFVAPVEGGLTQGIAGTSDPAFLAESQPYEVESISVLDVEAQRFLIYIPGAPALVNSLTNSTLRADSVVTIRRMGETPPPGPAPSTISTVPASGAPNALRTPPPDGLTQGMAGTNDPSALAAAQPFPVRSISVLDVPTQRWLVYIVGAPPAVNTLHTGSMKAESIVTVRRVGGDGQQAGPPPDISTESGSASRSPTPSATPSATPTPTPTPSSTSTPTPTPSAGTPTPEPQTIGISYYYCEPGALPQGIGDGGGFCGGMANGQQVFEGAAACSPRSLGQRFRILGDPTERVYVCADVGANASDSHREVWFPNSDAGWTWWQAVGNTARIQILTE